MLKNIVFVRIMVVLNLYYKQKLKVFIETSRMNAHLDDDQLIEILSNRSTNELIHNEEKIKDKIEE